MAKKVEKKNLIVSQILADRLLLKRVESESKTAGGIIIPDNAKEPKSKAIIMQVGPKVNEKDVLKVGKTVLFGKYGGQETDIDGVTYIMIKEPELLAVID